jgi:hypothetical protein
LSDEELQALLNGDVDLYSVEVEESPKASASTSEEKTEEKKEDKKEDKKEKGEEHHDPDGGVKSIIPEAPVPNDDNRMVEQLDDVTRDSEQKASEIFDSIDMINESLANIEEKISGDVRNNLEFNIEVFEKLTQQFPKIQTFQTALENNQKCIENMEEVTESIYSNQDEIMMIMDKMQYQDIHRQKIERVINVMRSLALYMNHLFSSSVEDSKRTSSAKHLEGDKSTDLVADDDIEALIASFGSR